MSYLISVLALVVSLFVVGSAQTSNTTQSTKDGGHSYGYIFAAPGGTSGGGGGTLHVGGGGEAVHKKGFGVGAELAYLMPFESAGQGLGTFSVNGSYHFLKSSKSEKLVPFVTAGYTGFFRGGYANGVNFGGGVNYWFKPRVGFRVEFRDNVFVQEGSAHLLNVRFGLTFR